MKCERCGEDFPSVFWFKDQGAKGPWVCLECAADPGRGGCSTQALAGGAPNPQQPPADIHHEPSVEPQLVGIRGWLILPAIGIILSPIFQVVGIMVLSEMIPTILRMRIPGSPEPVGLELCRLEILVTVGFLVFTICAAKRFFGKRKNAPAMLIGLMIASVAASGLLLLVALLAGEEEFVIIGGRGLILGIPQAVIWILYFKISRRVKATFVN